MATIEELRSQLNTNAYVPKTEEQIRAEAEAQNKGIYEQNKLNAQQAYDSTINALRNQLATLGTAYDRQIEEAQKATRASISARDRASIGRGMQRSSYNAATLANLEAQGEKTLAGIQADRTAAENALASQEALATQQLADQIAQLDSTYVTDVQAAIDALKEQEYNRQQADKQYLNNLLMQLFELEQNTRINDLNYKIQAEKLKSLNSSNNNNNNNYNPTGSPNPTDAPNPDSNVPPANVPSIDSLLGTLNGNTPVANGDLSGFVDLLKKNLGQAAATVKK